MVSSLADGRAKNTPNKKMLAPTGPASGRIAMKKKATKHVPKSPDAELFGGSPLVALREGALRFRVVAVFRVISEHPTGLTDDNATTTTRNTKPASSASARPVPRVRRVCGGHGGAVVLAVGRVAFVSCATRRGAGTTLNDSDAAA